MLASKSMNYFRVVFASIFSAFPQVRVSCLLSKSRCRYSEVDIEPKVLMYVVEDISIYTVYAVGGNKVFKNY